MKTSIISIGICVLFILIVAHPMTLGLDTETTVEDEYLQNLAFYCYDGYGSAKQDYYKEYLQRVDTTEVTVELDRVSLPVELPSDISSGGPMNSAWPMKCHDTRHTGRSPYCTADNPYDEIWRFETDGWIDGGPVIDCDGTIYFAGSHNELNNYLIAVNSDGTLKWRYKTDGLIISTPAIDENRTIYIGTFDDYLYAINPNGTRKWRFLAHATITSSPAIAEDGTIYFGVMGPSYDKGRIYAVNPDGTEKWYYDTGYWITSDPAIGNDGTIYIGSGDKYLYAMNPNGTLKWRYKTGDIVKGPPSIADDGTVYVGSYDNNLYAFYPDNGTLKWKLGGMGTETNPSIASDGTIYIGDEDLFAINPNGTLKWIYDLKNGRHIHRSSPAISSDGIIYVGTNINEVDGGDILAINPNGTLRWSKKLANEWVDSSPCISEDGVVYIGSSSMTSGEDYGYLHAFDNIESNAPPDAPDITGKTNGKPDTEYTYTFVPIDPDNNPVRMYVDWGEGTIINWTREYASGEQVRLKHTWTDVGNYTIKVKVKDSLDEEGPWGYLEVTIPRTRVSSYHWLFERFPLLERLLSFLLL